MLDLSPHIEYGLHEYGAFEFGKEVSLKVSEFSLRGVSNSAILSSSLKNSHSSIKGWAGTGISAMSHHNGTYSIMGESYYFSRTHAVQELQASIHSETSLYFQSGGSVFSFMGNSITDGVGNYFAMVDALSQAEASLNAELVKVQVGHTEIQGSSSTDAVGFTVRILGADGSVSGSSFVDIHGGRIVLSRFLHTGTTTLFVDTGNLFMTSFLSAYDVLIRPVELRNVFRPEELRTVFRPQGDRDSTIKDTRG